MFRKEINKKNEENWHWYFIKNSKGEKVATRILIIFFFLKEIYQTENNRLSWEIS